MAESQLKRLRSENESDDSHPISKRHKLPHANIPPLLEDDEPSHDLSAVLHHEISSDAAFDIDSPPAEDRKTGGEEDESTVSVMRHLLEASDDELGIPNPEGCNSNGGIRSDFDFEFEFSPPLFGFVDDGIWELEDVAANYYAVLQSELFM